jgi:osmotically-inducible protein OsmY
MVYSLVTVVLLVGSAVAAQEHVPLSDEQIQQFIEHKLIEEKLLKGNLTASVEGGVVTFTGQVPNIWTKEKVVEIALEVPDTKEVLSELSIATGESDQDLAKQIADKIRRYSFYTIYDEISGGVQEGVVFLSGWVTMPFKSAQIEEMASKVLGVQEVRNEIKVLPTSTTDDRLRDTLSRRIYGDPTFSQYAFQAHPPIHIIVDGSRVTLTGVVLSQVEKVKAERIARSTFGVLSVENRLRVGS